MGRVATHVLKKGAGPAAQAFRALTKSEGGATRAAVTEAAKTPLSKLPVAVNDAVGVSAEKKAMGAGAGLGKKAGPPVAPKPQIPPKPERLKEASAKLSVK